MTNTQPIFINILTMNGSGTHLIQDLMVAMGLEQLATEDTFWPALIMARRNPEAPFTYRDCQGTPALTVIENFHKSVRGEIPTNPLSDQEVKKTFSQILSDKGQKQLFISNQFPLIYSGDMVVDPTCGDTWTLDDRDAARAALRAAIEAAGWCYLELVVIRHPVDIFISNVERFSEISSHDVLKRQIKEFFALVDDRRNKGIPVVRYEDICSGNTGPLTETLEGFGISKVAISKALDIPHSGQIDRWMLNRTEAINQVAQEFSSPLVPNGYSFESGTDICRPWTNTRKWLQKLLAEVQSTNQIVNGNYLSHSAFTRHRRTIFGAVYLRLLLIWPPFRRNYRNLYQDFYGTPVPMKPLAGRLGRNFEGTLKGRFIALLVGLVLVVFISEGLLRVAMPHWREFYNGSFMRLIEVPGYGRVTTGKPGFDGYFAQNNGDFRVRIHINKFGLRDPGLISAANGRIWIVGDSMAFGWGVEQNQTYTSVIGQILGQPTYNIASPGTNVCGYQALYKRMPATVRPKAVIIGLILENDMRIYDCRAMATPAAIAKSREIEAPSLIEIKMAFTHYSALYNFLAVALKRVTLIRESLISIGLLNRPHAYLRSFATDEIDSVAASTASELSRLKAMTPPGTPFAVLLAPARVEIRNGDLPYRKMRLKITEELVKRGIAVIDPYKNFVAAGFRPTHFAHDGHWSVLGHRIAGAAVAAWLKTQIGGK